MLSNSERRRFDEIVRQLEQESGAGAEVTPLPGRPAGTGPAGHRSAQPAGPRGRGMPVADRARRDAVWQLLVVLGIVGTLAGLVTLQLTVLIGLGLVPLAAAAWLRARSRPGTSSGP